MVVMLDSCFTVALYGCPARQLFHSGAVWLSMLGSCFTVALYGCPARQLFHSGAVWLSC